MIDKQPPALPGITHPPSRALVKHRPARKPAAARAKAVPVVATQVIPLDEPFNLKEGEIDPETGLKIDHIIAAYETSIIYLDAHNNLIYRSTDDHVWPDEEQLLTIEADYSDLSDVAKFQLSGVEQRRVMILLGHAVDAIFSNYNFKAAKRAIELARAKLFERSGQELRTTVIWSGLIGAIGALVSALVLVDEPVTFPGINSLYVMSVAAGIVGAALSLMQRSSTFAVTRIATRVDYISECVARLFIGSIAGVIAALAVGANVMFGFMTKAVENAGGNTTLIVLLALFAGISERFIPMFVKGIETQLSSEQKAEKDKPKTDGDKAGEKT